VRYIAVRRETFAGKLADSQIREQRKGSVLSQEVTRYSVLTNPLA
jgi:hypothetical protein